MRHSTGRPTQVQQVRLERLAGMRCLACLIQGPPQPFRTEVHHLVDFGYRKHSGGHDATVPLCGWHHRGQCLPGWTGSQMRDRFGPSLALSRREFVGAFYPERDLLEITDEALRIMDELEACA